MGAEPSFPQAVSAIWIRSCMPTEALMWNKHYWPRNLRQSSRNTEHCIKLFSYTDIRINYFLCLFSFPWLFPPSALVYLHLCKATVHQADLCNRSNSSNVCFVTSKINLIHINQDATSNGIYHSIITWECIDNSEMEMSSKCKTLYYIKGANKRLSLLLSCKSKTSIFLHTFHIF